MFSLPNEVDNPTDFQLEALRLGYQQTTLKKVFEHLYRYVLPNKSTILYSGDIDMVAGILKELLVHMKNFPQLVLKDDKISGLVSILISTKTYSIQGFLKVI